MEASERVILFLDDDPNRAALLYQRMNEEDRGKTIWTTTAEQAIEVLQNYAPRLERVWLDHDLGGETFVHSGREDCGMEVVRWLEKASSADYKECEFIVHSWNIPTAQKMASRLDAAGYTVTQVPFGM